MPTGELQLGVVNVSPHSAMYCQLERIHILVEVSIFLQAIMHDCHNESQAKQHPTVEIIPTGIDRLFTTATLHINKMSYKTLAQRRIRVLRKLINVEIMTRLYEFHIVTSQQMPLQH